MPLILPKPAPSRERPSQNNRIAFLPVLLLAGATIVGVSFAAGERSAGGAGHLRTAGAAEASGPPATTGLPDIESPLPPARVLVSILGVLQRRAVDDPNRRVILEQGDVERMYGLAARVKVEHESDKKRLRLLHGRIRQEQTARFSAQGAERNGPQVQDVLPPPFPGDAPLTSSVRAVD